MGIDVSVNTLGAANKLKEFGELDYTLPIEGDIKHNFTAKVDTKIVSGIYYTIVYSYLIRQASLCIVRLGILILLCIQL